VSMNEERPAAEPDARGAGGRKLLAPIVMAPILAAVAAAVRLWAFSGVTRLDMFRYVEISYHVLHGGSLFDPQVFFASSRLPLMLPLIASNAIGGFGEHASVLWPLICSVAAVVIAYLLARELFGDAAGILAGMLMAVFPLEVEMGTQLLPDPIEGLFVLAAIYFAVLAVNRDSNWRRWSILSGVCVLIAYQTRVNAILFLLGVLAVGAILHPERWRRSLWAVLGVAIGVVGFGLAFWALSGDPIIDLHKALQAFGAYRSSGFIVRRATFAFLIRNEPSLVWAIPAGILGLVGLALRPERRKWLLAAWAILFYVYLEFVSPLHGLDSSYRYAEPLIAPLLILGAAGVIELVRRTRAHASQVVAAFVGGMVVLAMLQSDLSIARSWRDGPIARSQRLIASIIARDPKAVVYYDHPGFMVAVNYFSGYTLGRDTLDPPSAPVNRKARLFLLSEKTPTPGRAALVVAAYTKDVPAGAVLVRAIPYPGITLGLYRTR
jgi:4-amino-4-deoxy-L-arabinose transferase-like glycosyltransferase